MDVAYEVFGTILLIAISCITIFMAIIGSIFSLVSIIRFIRRK